MDEIVFTPSGLLSFLCEIEELSNKDIDLSETDSAINITIGENTYSINTSSAEEVEVADECVQEVSDVNEEGYDDLDISEGEEIEGGIIKELIKTLAIGGMVRLTSSALAPKQK